MVIVLDSFAADPIVTHSGRFPLGPPAEQVDLSLPSPAAVRPWGLRWMSPVPNQGDSVMGRFGYDHARQIAVDCHGVPLTVVAATANKVTNNDGDEGPSEDFTYDYCPDFPGTV